MGLLHCRQISVLSEPPGSGYKAEKGGTRKLCDDGAILYLECSGGYMKPYITKLHRNKNLRCKITVSVSMYSKNT